MKEKYRKEIREIRKGNRRKRDFYIVSLLLKKKRSCNNEIARSAYRSSQALVYELETFISFDFKKKSKIKMRT